MYAIIYNIRIIIYNIRNKICLTQTYVAYNKFNIVFASFLDYRFV